MPRFAPVAEIARCHQNRHANPPFLRRVMRRLLPPVLAGLAAFFLSAGVPARAAGDLPDAPPDGWWCYYGQTAQDVGSLLAANNARLLTVQVEQTSPLRFTVTMVRNTGAYAKTWWWYYGQSATDIANKARDLNARIINLDAYQIGQNLLFAAVFISNTGPDARGWWWYYGEDPGNIAGLVQQNKARLIDLRQYTFNRFTKYALVMVDNSGADSLGWWYYYNITAPQVSTFVQNNGAYLVSLQVANINGPTFNVVMNKLPTPGGRGWWWYYGITPPVLQELYTRNIAWTRDLKTYQLGGRRVFSALMLGLPPGPQSVTTYHYDNNRTGWNNKEVVLDPGNMGRSRFDLRQTVALDDQVDAQPRLCCTSGMVEGGGMQRTPQSVTTSDIGSRAARLFGARLAIDEEQPAEDAEPVRQCNRYLQLAAAWREAGLRGDGAAEKLVHRELTVTYRRLCRTRGRTAAGRRAKARAMIEALPKEADNLTPCREEDELAWSLARDVLWA